jgi:hypothetical protein
MVAGAVLWCLVLTGCNLPHLFFSYPRLWDYTKIRPKDADLVGTYGVLALRLPSNLSRAVKERESLITLKADHTATLASVPQFDGFGDTLKCRLSGSATWSLDDAINSGWGWSLAFQNYHGSLQQRQGECDYENTTWGILVLSRHPPYRLYAMVGDPDSDTGVEYRKLEH